MKKAFIIILILLSSIFLINLKFNAEGYYEGSSEQKENYYKIDFENLNSKNLNELLKDINGTVISIEVTTEYFTKTYTFNTRITNNLEEELTKKVINDLIKINKRESATYYETKGYKINEIEIICTKEMVTILKNKAKFLEN